MSDHRIAGWPPELPHAQHPPRTSVRVGLDSAFLALAALSGGIMAFEPLGQPDQEAKVLSPRPVS